MQGNQSSADGEGRSPLILQDVQADCTSLRANIRVPDLGVELHLGRLEWIVRRNGNVNIKDATFVACVFLN